MNFFQDDNDPTEEFALDLSIPKTLWELHKYVKKALRFPNYYGENLDAFRDCVTDLCDCHITIYGIHAMHKDVVLQDTWNRMLKLLQEAIKLEPSIKLKIID